MSRGENDSYISARVPNAVTRAIEAIADGEGVSFSEALRWMLVAGLESRGYREHITDEHGRREDTSWRQPAPPG